jgi:hypothetical protein
MNGFELVIRKFPFLNLNSPLNLRIMILIEPERLELDWYHRIT